MPQSKSRSLCSRRIDFERCLCVILSACIHVERCGSNNTHFRRNRHCTAIPAFCKAKAFSPCIGRVVSEDSLNPTYGDFHAVGISAVHLNRNRRRTGSHSFQRCSIYRYHARVRRYDLCIRVVFVKDIRRIRKHNTSFVFSDCPFRCQCIFVCDCGTCLIRQ